VTDVHLYLKVLNILTNHTHCGLQDGIEASLGSVQVARYFLLLELLDEGICVVHQGDDVCERERRVAVGPRLFESEEVKKEGGCRKKEREERG